MSTGAGSESSGGTRPDCGHLDEDAECLEDPVHCGDARHQHAAHQPTAAPGDAAKAATTGETSQA